MAEYFLCKFICGRCGRGKLVCFRQETPDEDYCYCLSCNSFRRGKIFIQDKIIEDDMVEICASCKDIVPIDENSKCLNCKADTKYSSEEEKS